MLCFVTQGLGNGKRNTTNGMKQYRIRTQKPKAFRARNVYKEDKYLINQLRTELLFESMIQDNSLITPRQGKMMWWMNAQYNGNFNKHIIQEA